MTRGFSAELLNAPVSKDWKEVRTFPLSVKKHLPAPGKFGVFSFVHYFDLNENFLAGNAQPALGTGSIGEVFEYLY
ncbi:MAG: hypothetical protein QM744_19705 [Mesorhizobium sp.]